MIDHAVWVTTDLFETTTPSANFINSRCFGEDFALWLQARLTERGLTASEPIQEDWGWVVLVTFADRKFTISIGIMDESIGHIPASWRIGVSYEKPLNSFRTWLKPAPVESLSALFQDVRNVLAVEPRFHVTEDEP